MKKNFALCLDVMISQMEQHQHLRLVWYTYDSYLQDSIVGSIKKAVKGDSYLHFFEDVCFGTFKLQKKTQNFRDKVCSHLLLEVILVKVLIMNLYLNMKYIYC